MIFVQQKIRELTNVATENFIPQQKITFTVSCKDYFHCSEQFCKCTIIFVQQNFRELTTTEVFNPCHRGNTFFLRKPWEHLSIYPFANKYEQSRPEIKSQLSSTSVSVIKQ
jgi:hypothetical protein